MDSSSDASPPFSQLIVIGASAGGIEALTALVASIPAGLPAPIVVAQHLSRHRASSLSEILERHGQLPVRTIVAQETLQPGVIYVVPPDRDVSITDHEVRVHSDDGGGPRPSIDLLFRSASAVYREDLIAVVLSGTGSDGAAGAREVKQLGGTVIIQNPETASFPGMPLSLPPSIVDIVANPDMIGPLLHDLLSGVFAVPQQTEKDQLSGLLEQLRDETGIDFSSYKKATISRRLQRRMAATGKTPLSEYIGYLRLHTDERRRLVGSFLIKVTEFFRDPDLFQYLRKHLLPELIKDATRRGAELRLWSAGCATGEEAYSLALIVAELLEEAEEKVPVRIFATDLDAGAVAHARRGIYPARALLPLPPYMIERYFIEHEGDYEIKKEIRSMLVFGEHDLAQRAPFPRIDLILCRNVLIYFTPVLQRRALQLFAFALRSGGYLVLGKSETVSPLAEYFGLDQSRLKIYRRVGERVLIPPGRLREATAALPNATRASFPPRSIQPGPARAHAAAHPPVPRYGTRPDLVLQSIPIGVVTVDRRYDVQFINTAARRMLGIHETAIGHDFLHMLRDIPAKPLRAAIDHAFAGSTEELALTFDEASAGGPRSVRATAAPMAGDEAGDAMVLLSFTDVSELEEIRRQGEAQATRVERLAADNEALVTANIDLSNTITRLLAENEDMLVSAEEVQAATEEIETLNEELQASNEELETLNEELQATVEELNTTNDDLQARALELQAMALESESARGRLETILTSISDAVLVVDEGGRPVMINPAYERMFGAADTLLAPEGAIGQPLPPEQSPEMRAARGETFSLSFTMTGADGQRRWYEAESHPLPNNTGRLGVITIRDITERSLRRLQDEWLAIAAHELRTPVAALQGYLQLTRRDAQAVQNTPFLRRLDRSLGQIRRIASLIDHMVDATRFQAGPVSVELQEFDIVQQVEQAIETVEIAKPETAPVRFDHPEGPVLITGDPARIEQAVLNVLVNAATHSPDPVDIEVTLREQDGSVRLTITDNGPGIAPDLLPTIFDRFSQGKQVTGGLGLGLYITHEIVAGHGGTITVESTVGEGTTFVIELPRRPEKPVL